MGQSKAIAPCLVILMISAQQSFVDTAPTSTPAASPLPLVPKFTPNGSPEVVPEILDANVRELESLKQTIGKTLEMIKSPSSVYGNINGQVRSRLGRKSEVREDGKLAAGMDERIDGEQPSGDASPSGSLRIDVDIPEENTHRSTVQHLLPDIRPHSASMKRDDAGDQDEDIAASAISASHSAGAMAKFVDSQYTPLDMAQYVFWTGDEKGVTLAVEESLQAGIMTREEAISFLQEIKYNLDYLQNHYSTQLRVNSAGDRSKVNTENLPAQLLKNNPENTIDHFDLTELRYQSRPTKKKTSSHQNSKVSEVSKQQTDGEYDEIIDRLKVADFLYTEYSLEEVIYQLAKVMFTQGLTRGSVEAQRALQKFTTFLETEAEQAHISRTLEKKVLDVLIASLTDTLSEHPEIEAMREYAQDEDRHAALHRLAQMTQIPPERNPRAKRVDIQLGREDRALGKYNTVG